MMLIRLGRIVACCSLVGGALVPLVSFAQLEPLAANHIIIDERLHTSGQPDPLALGSLAEQAFDMVVNLAPPTVQGAVAEERDLLESSGVAYVNIPVDFRNPTYADFERFSDVLRQARGGRVLVHCQINARASMFTFLYRVVHEGVAPTDAFEHVKQVWTPVEHWARFGETVLEQHGVDFVFP